MVIACLQVDYLIWLAVLLQVLSAVFRGLIGGIAPVKSLYEWMAVVELSPEAIKHTACSAAEDTAMDLVRIVIGIVLGFLAPLVALLARCRCVVALFFGTLQVFSSPSYCLADCLQPETDSVIWEPGWEHNTLTH